MLTVKDYDYDKNYRVLKNSPQVFHEALKYVMRGETRFHVDNGEEDEFDLFYIDNDSAAKSDPTFPDSSYFREEMIFPPYFDYDETDIDKITMDFLDGFEEIFFEEASEYTIVIAEIALAHTSVCVTFRDRKVSLFPWLTDRVRVSSKPMMKETLYVQKQYYPVYIVKDRFCSKGLFHCMFMLQWLTDLPREKIKYLQLTIRRLEGIGSVLSTYFRVKQAFDRFGIRIFLTPGCTRYPEEMLEKYFKIDPAPDDSDESNTIYTVCFNGFVINRFIQRYEAKLDHDIIQPKFLNEMKEYADSVIGQKKVLGVLLRGTDVVIANYAAAYHPADIDVCIRIIEERMEEYQYERIFLATEDSTFLEKMLKAFPGKVIVVSQERHRISDFKSVHYIADLEKLEHSRDTYLASVEDTTVNYLYAMYMLSRCESLVANCKCSGLDLAVSFNEGKYVRKDIVSMMV